jgi:hypothetical protein
LRARLEAFKQETKFSLGELSKKLNAGATQVSKYLNKHPEGDVATLEATIEDVLGAAARRKLATEVVLFECRAARDVAAVMELIRKTNDIGLIHGAAGVGKTCGSLRYLQDHPSAIMIRISKWFCGGHAVASLLFDAMETRSWPGNEAKVPWMATRLRNSDRLIIVDNAHRLQASGLEWLFDFHDETHVPIALVGNPEILDKIRKNDQQFSRVGLVQEITVKDADHVAKTMIGQMAPEAAGIQDMAEVIVEKRGHARALRKHLMLLPEMLAKAKGNVREAIAMAHTKLVSDYTLLD